MSSISITGDFKHLIIAGGIVVAAGVMIIFTAGYSFNVEVGTDYIYEVAAYYQGNYQTSLPIDIDQLPPELPADHYLDRDLAVHNYPPGSPAPRAMVLLNDREYEIAKACYLPSDISWREFRRLKKELAAIYRSGGFGYPNTEETKDRAN